MILVYYSVRNRKLKNLIILIASLVFYGYGEPKFIYIMLGLIVVNYFLVSWMCIHPYGTIRRIVCMTAVAIDLGFLFVVKYLSFFLRIVKGITGRNITIIGITLPIGISFFTFQMISYVIDVYKERVEQEKSILNVSLYISFFPQLIAGPIVRYNTISEQIRDRKESFEKFGAGTERFMCGFAKKVIIANNLALITESIFGASSLFETSIIVVWLAIIGYALQIYYDFSGYSDMAIGLGKMFGFDFDENFNYPYMAKSITDFWRRWHISLSAWFKDYVYIPLGGNRGQKHVRNLFVIWFLTGLWHGANYTFLVWGMIYFLFILLEKYLVKPERRKRSVVSIWRIITLFVITYDWVIFNSMSLHQAKKIILAAFGCGSYIGINGEVYYVLREYWIYYAFALLFVFPVASFFSEYITVNATMKNVYQIVASIGYVFSFLWAVSFLVLGAHNPFIYFNF